MFDALHLDTFHEWEKLNNEAQSPGLFKDTVYPLNQDWNGLNDQIEHHLDVLHIDMLEQPKDKCWVEPKSEMIAKKSLSTNDDTSLTFEPFMDLENPMNQFESKS